MDQQPAVFPRSDCLGWPWLAAWTCSCLEGCLAGSSWLWLGSALAPWLSGFLATWLSGTLALWLSLRFCLNALNHTGPGFALGSFVQICLRTPSSRAEPSLPHGTCRARPGRAPANGYCGPGRAEPYSRASKRRAGPSRASWPSLGEPSLAEPRCQTEPGRGEPNHRAYKDRAES